MSPGTLVHRVGRLLSAFILIVSGVYVFTYLVRWEWNRALVAGMFFLAAEGILIADVLLGRIAGVSRQVAQTHESAQTAALAARLRANRPRSPGPFAWLAPERDRLNVLLPILIGAGVILSALSYVVEQLSRVTAVPVAERELARGLSTMALPAEGLAPGGRAPVITPAEARRREPEARALTWIVLGGVVAAIAAGILVLARAIMAVPEGSYHDRALEMDLVVMRRDLEQPEADIALALWTLCRVRVHDAVELVTIEPSDDDHPGQLRMVLSPAPGKSDTFELLGCVQDAVIERARADVVAVRAVDR